MVTPWPGLAQRPAAPQLHDDEVGVVVGAHGDLGGLEGVDVLLPRQPPGR